MTAIPGKAVCTRCGGCIVEDLAMVTLESGPGRSSSLVLCVECREAFEAWAGPRRSAVPARRAVVLGTRAYLTRSGGR